jgi:hypothetical protein
MSTTLPQDPRTIYGNAERLAAIYPDYIVPPPLDVDYLLATGTIPTSIPISQPYPFPSPAGPWTPTVAAANGQCATDTDTLSYLVGYWVTNPGQAPPVYLLQGVANCVINPYKYKGFIWKNNGIWTPF